ncbi:VOC family protein [Labrys sp. ZIDIC5]|uniref:bleomycin resistance protein n=1 Tax=Labrys sedimenti TaxID=3106036 RepID=UPI002AC9FC39|nr:VOC family protein [Labrys sp. ZIDIC5]MDZ5452597.1 VOC family protein [Labrys sp. ZIDIC5]
MNQAVTARLTGAIPTLASLSFEETTQFYQKLGFEVLHSDISFLLLHRDGVRLSFWLTGNRRVPQATSCWLEVTGIAALYEHFNALNIVHRKGHLEAKPWGTREFSITDCHGNLIRFAEQLQEH